MVEGKSVSRAEAAFVRAAQRAAEIFGQILKLRAGTEIAFGETYFFIVNPTAEITYMLHNQNTSFLKDLFYVLYVPRKTGNETRC